MPITLNCTCGKTLRIADEHAGKRVKCPGCNVIIAPLPPPLPQFEMVEGHAPLPVAKSRPHDGDDGDARAGFLMQKAEKPPDLPRKKPNFRKGESEDDNPRMGSRRSRSKAKAAEAAVQRKVYIVGGGIALAVGIGFAIAGNNGEGRGATKLIVAGVLIGLFGLVSLVQGITGNLPDDGDD